jgi:hypothetical protein
MIFEGNPEKYNLMVLLIIVVRRLLFIPPKAASQQIGAISQSNYRLTVFRPAAHQLPPRHSPERCSTHLSHHKTLLVQLETHRLRQTTRRETRTHLARIAAMLKTASHRSYTYAYAG